MILRLALLCAKIICATCKECGKKCIEKAKGRCSSCYDRIRRQDNLETIKEKERIWSKNYRIAHPEKKKAWDKRYQLKNLPKFSARTKKWRRAHPEKARQLTNSWRAKNRDKMAEYQNARRARLRLLDATLTLEQWKRILGHFNNRCAYCGSSGPLGQDHVIPIARGGGHVLGNVVPSCRSCNSQKSTRIWQPIRFTAARET